MFFSFDWRHLPGRRLVSGAHYRDVNPCAQLSKHCLVRRDMS